MEATKVWLVYECLLPEDLMCSDHLFEISRQRGSGALSDKSAPTLD
jgi:hypothetical protein